MKNSMTKEQLEKLMLSETEIEIRKNVEDLAKWLDGSLKYFVYSIKGLAERTQDKTLFRSFVTRHILDNLEKLSEVADIFDVDVIPGKDTQDDAEADKTKFFLDADDIDFKELIRYYNSKIVSILAINTDVLDSMRFRINMLHVISSTPSEFGHSVLDYVTHRVLMTQIEEMPKKISTMLCLVAAIREHGYGEYGKYADIIETIVDDLSLAVCMSITKDYENTKKPN